MHRQDMDLLSEFDDVDWYAGQAGAPTRGVEAVLESGRVLCFPALAFALSDHEQALLDPRHADPKSKNISLRGDAVATELRGAVGSAETLQALAAMVSRFRTQAQALAGRLFPHYDGHLTLGSTSFRPVPVAGRSTSWRKDDSRLHVDAFPSNPTQGQRLLRVFTNINPRGQPRAWRLGEDFEAFARRLLPQIPRPWPGSAWALQWLHITKRRRTLYDHFMLQLHDRAKADLAWQQNGPQQAVDFAPGTTWVVYSDQVMHAAMAGQFMMEQTFTLPPERQLDPQTSPLHVLERLAGQPLRA
jgi:hypothetical protein